MGIGGGILVFFFSLTALVAEFIIYFIVGMMFGSSSSGAYFFVFLMFLTIFIGVFYPICAAIASGTNNKERGQKLFLLGLLFFGGILIVVLRHLPRQPNLVSAGLAEYKPFKKKYSKSEKVKKEEPQYLNDELVNKHFEDRLGVADLLSNGLGVVTPNEKFIYSLNMMQVFQSAEGGVLIKGSSALTWGSGLTTAVAFLYTDEDFVDGASLDSCWASYIGTYKYQTVLGVEKNIHAFKLISNWKGKVAKTYHSNGKIKKETFLKNEISQNEKPDGVSKDYYQSGNLETIALFKNGKQDGLTKAYFENGNLEREVLFKGGIQNGSFELYYENGNLKEEGLYKDGKANGPNKIFYPNGVVSSERNYKDDKAEGQFKVYYEDGSKQGEGVAENGQPVGKAITYYRNGQIKSEKNFRNGLLDGELKTYYESGALRSVMTYERDVRSGFWEQYFEDGELMWRWNYINGEWEKNNQAATFKNSTEGMNKFFFENKTLAYEINISNHRFEGPLKEYYQNGKLRAETIFLNGVPDGDAKSYDDDGTLNQTTTYKHGVEMKEPNFITVNGKVVPNPKKQ